MENLSEDMWVEVLGRLSSEKDLVPCMSVSRLWHRITSDIWVRRYWVQSPPLGLFYRTATTSPTSTVDDKILDREWYKPGPIVEHTDSDEYLNGCNGLLLLMKSATYQFYVCNPITGQQVAIPKARVHQNHDDQLFCAALAFDPSESAHRYHFRVVRIDYSTSGSVLLDIFSSEYGLWVRNQLQIDSCFTEGFRNSKFCTHFVYLRGKLYSLSLSWNLLCIDLDSVIASALALPNQADDKTGGMGCVGVSMDSLCYMKRMPDISKASHNLVVWYYDDESGEWIPRYSVSCRELLYKYEGLGYGYDDIMEPFGISPTSDLLFYHFCGNPKLIFCIHLRSGKTKYVCKARHEVHQPAFLALRAYFVPFYTHLNKKNDVSTSLAQDGSTEILSVEMPYGRQEDDDSVEVIDVKLYDSMKNIPSPSLVYPSEIIGMHVELGKAYIYR